MGAQACLWGSLGGFAALIPPSIGALEGSTTMIGWVFSAFAVALGVGARVAGRIMDRVGRRPGLVGGYVALGIGGALCAASLPTGSLPLLVVATALLGLGTAAAQLGRAAVADMYEPARRGRAVGALAVAGTIGAVAGPQFGALVHTVTGGTQAGLAVAWLIVPVLAAVSLALVIALRPDPAALAIDRTAPMPGAASGGVLRTAPALAAVVTIAVAHATMNLFMGVVPLSLHEHGAGQPVLSTVVSFHLAGMFAMSPLVGAFLDRWGRRRGLLAGAVILGGGAAVCAVGDSTVELATGLTLIGIGWSFCFLGSTATISDLTDQAHRAGALGRMDLVTGLSTAVGVPAGAALAGSAGLPVLGIVVVSALVVPIALELRVRERAPGSWEAEEVTEGGLYNRNP